MTLERFYDDFYRQGSRLGHMNDVRHRDLIRQSRFVLDLLPRTRARLLDVACGGGGFCYFAAERHEVEGIDFCQAAVDHAAGLVPAGRFRKAAAEHLPYEDATFDLVTCVGSLEHIPDMDAALREMRRVLKPGGQVAVLVPNLFSLENVLAVCLRGEILSHGQELERFDTPGGWRRLLERNGLRVRRMAPYNAPATWPLLAKHPRTAALRMAYHLTPAHLSSLLVFVAEATCEPPR